MLDRCTFTIILLCLTAIFCASAELHIPPDADIMVSMPGIADDVIGITIKFNGEMQSINKKYQTIMKTATIEDAVGTRKIILESVSRFTASGKDTLGPGFNTLAVIIGTNGQTIEVRWSWNDKKSVPIPDDAKVVRDAVAKLLQDSK